MRAAAVLMMWLSCACQNRGGPTDPSPARGQTPARAGSEPQAQSRPRADRQATGSYTLFIGNSLLRYRAAGAHAAYDIPATVQAMRTAAGAGGRATVPVQTFRVLASDGMGLGSWWRSYHGYAADNGDNVSAARAIVEDPHNSRRYDRNLAYEPLPAGSGPFRRVVLVSLLNYVDPERWEGDPDQGAELPNLERWLRFIREKASGAEVLHYVGPADSRKIRERQAVVDARFERIRAEWGGRVIPVGRAFLDVMQARPDVELRRPDQDDFIHMNANGVLVAASVLYGVLYGDPTQVPLPPELASIDPTIATDLRRIAWSAVQHTSVH